MVNSTIMWVNQPTFLIFLKGPIGLEPIPQEPESYTLSIKLWALKYLRLCGGKGPHSDS